MNIYGCRFIDSYDHVFHITQYGRSVDEINSFWTQWWPKHYPDDKDHKFIDCVLLYENVKYDEKSERKRVMKALKISEK